MRKLLVLAALSAAGFGIWHWQSPARDREILRDRIWIDHLPRSEREPIQTFVILKDNPGGAFNSASMWKGTYELFRYEMTGRQIRMDFPQTGDRDNVRVEASKCRENGMDYCLTIEGSSRGVKRYYSREGWEIRSLDEVRAKLDTLASE